MIDELCAYDLFTQLYNIQVVARCRFTIGSVVSGSSNPCSKLLVYATSIAKHMMNAQTLKLNDLFIISRQGTVGRPTRVGLEWYKAHRGRRSTPDNPRLVAHSPPLCSKPFKMHFPALVVLIAACAHSVVGASIPGNLKLKREDASSSFSLDPSSEPLAFKYATDSPDDSNWIGLWPAGEGPVDGEQTDASLTWEYAPDAEGSVQISVSKLQPGDSYAAFYLANDGYESLADPIEVTFEGLPGDLSFPVEKATLINARRGEKYEARIGGLVLGKKSSSVTFEKTSGDAWISVSSDGTVSGTPDGKCPDKSTAEITATAEDDSTASIRITIPVRRKEQPLVEDLAVMSYNTWSGGSNINDYHAKQLRFILDSGVDIIGLQEAADGDHVIRLADALGWDYWQSDRSVGVLSRYQIVKEYGEVAPVEVPVEGSKNSPGGGVRISLNGASDYVSELNFWTAHLHYTPYGPYDFCFDNMTVDEVLEQEAFSGRPAQMEGILNAMAPQLDAASDTPVLLVGDMNAPSHLDWVDALREKNCGIGGGFEWPTSILPTDAGLIDSFRVAHPDPVKAQCLSWSPIYPFNEGSSGPPEPQDRIDFIYGTKGLKVLGSECLVAGDPKPVPDHEDNEWTSDHMAVLTHYRLI